MKKRAVKGRKKIAINPFKRRYLSHSYKYSVTGENLVEEPNTKIKNKLLLTGMISIPVFFVLIYVLNALMVVFKAIFSSILTGGATLPKVKDYLAGILLKRIVVSPALSIICIIAAVGIAALITLQLKFSTKVLAYGQKGDSRLAKQKEISEDFKAIDEAGTPFKGYGGTPISHYKNQFYIEDGAYNACYVGTSRSGKGQTAVLQLLENVSRAEKQSSVVVGDPKGELYAAAQKPYEERGYDTYAFNLINPGQSMGYDPLAIIKKYFRQGNTEYALQLINTLTFTLYDDPTAGQNKFFNTSAAKVVNALILTILEDAQKTGDWDKCTMNNVAEMLTELGKVSYKKDPDDPLSPMVNALDAYFNNLPPGNLAAKQYVGANFSGEKAKGSILATVAEKLTPFTMPSIARMTSKSSIDLKSVGFQKYIDFKASDSLVNQKIKVRFIDGSNQKLIYTAIGAVRASGFVEINLDCALKTRDLVEFISPDGKSVTKYEIKLNDKSNDYSVELSSIDDFDDFNIEKIDFKYSDRPVAIFLMLPDYDPSNHVLASIFISQLYTELSYQCSRTPGNKCYRRIQYILDEFGNLPAIANMDQILTVTNGRNMLWHLFVQAYSQIYNKYGKESGETIKQNCQTRVLIFTTDDNTTEEFSKAVGNRTVESNNADQSVTSMNKNLHASAESERILTYERLSQMLEGETLVLRPLHRRNLKGEKVRPYPIFNQKEHAMPYAYQFLTKYGFDPSRDVNGLKFDASNAMIDLDELRIDYSRFIVDDQGLEEYRRQSA